MNDTYSLTVDRIIPGPIDEVFDAWLDPESLRQWMRPGGMVLADVATNPVVGGKFHLVMTSDTETHPHDGEYRQIDRPHRLVFTWKSGPAGDTLVTITFTRISDRKTKVTLTHERFSSESARDGHERGWGSILEKLEQNMEVQSWR